MESTCLRLTELPNTSRLFADFVYHFDRVSRFYPYSPADPDALRKAAAAVEFPDGRRADLVSALEQSNPAGPLLETLARRGTVAIVTGQQAGLLGGPLYTVFKALTAVKLARELSQAGTPAVPVFWVATEDHDFAEVNHAWAFDAQNRPQRIEAANSGEPGSPVGGIRVEAAAAPRLRTILDGLPFCEEVAQLAAETYEDGATFGGAFVALLRRVLAPHDLLFLDPMRPEIRALLAPFLSRAVERAPELKRLLLERNRELQEAGYHAQVHVEPETSFVFRLESGKRVTLRREGDGYAVNGRRLTPEELAADGAALSPNALLRPVAQDYILPTAAYVGGPAELAYLAQAQVIYREMLGRMPLPFPRHTATLLDQKAAKRMDRYGLRLPDLLHNEDALRERIAKTLTPPALAALIGEKRGQLAGMLDELGAGISGFDPTLARAFEKSRRKMSYQLQKIEAKVAREAMRRDEHAQRDARYLNGLVYPHKHLQERIYTVLPFLARHGLDLAGRLYSEIRTDCPDHRVVVL